MRQQVSIAIRTILVLLVLVSGVYPAAVWAIGQLAFRDQANGSLITRDGKVVGSALIGQAFTSDRYFHPRPSAAGSGYDAAASGGSNLGPTSQKLHDRIAAEASNDMQRNAAPSSAFGTFSPEGRRVSIQELESDSKQKLESRPFSPPGEKVPKADEGVVSYPHHRPLRIPADAVTTSASGLDPHISPAYALLQVPRVARARGLGEARVRALVEQRTEGRFAGVYGEPRVNVLLLNIALDAIMNPHAARN